MNKVALITAGTGGIGLGIASALAQKGFSLVVTGRKSKSEVQGKLDTLAQSSPKVVYIRADATHLQEQTDLIKPILEEFGRIDILVNNAGIAPKTRLDILETTEESFDEVVDTNLKNTFFLTQRVAQVMVDLKTKGIPEYEPQIIFITSVSATLASVNRGEYCISKAGLAMAAQLFATRLAEFGIPVYEIRPGIIKTDMTAGVTEKYDKLIAEGLTLQPRWGFPEDVGKAVGALATGSFLYSTGSVFYVDGGLSVGRL